MLLSRLRGILIGIFIIFLLATVGLFVYYLSLTKKIPELPQVFNGYLTKSLPESAPGSRCSTSMSLTKETNKDKVNCGFYGSSDDKRVIYYLGLVEGVEKQGNKITLRLTFGDITKTLVLGILNKDVIAITESANPVLFPYTADTNQLQIKLDENGVASLSKYKNKFALASVQIIDNKFLQDLTSPGSEDEKDLVDYINKCLNKINKLEEDGQKGIFKQENSFGISDSCHEYSANFTLYL